MKRRMLLVALVCAVPVAMAADHAAPERKPDVVYHGAAIVNRVDANLGLLNLSHGAVPAVGWAPMTRDLRVKPRTLAYGLVPGMQIRFQLTAVDQVTYVITALEPLR